MKELFIWYRGLIPPLNVERRGEVEDFGSPKGGRGWPQFKDSGGPALEGD